MPKVDLEFIEQNNATGYPPPFDQEVEGRWKRRLGPSSGLTDFGVSQVTLKPGAWSSQRHWHDGEDEFLVMLTGEAVLVEDEGRSVLGPETAPPGRRESRTAITCATRATETAPSSWSGAAPIRAAAIPTST